MKLNEKQKEILIKKIKDDECQIFYDNKWDYPNDDTCGYNKFVQRVFGGSQRTIPILNMLFRIERHGGYVIKINSEELK